MRCAVCRSSVLPSSHASTLDDVSQLDDATYRSLERQLGTSTSGARDDEKDEHGNVVHCLGCIVKALLAVRKASGVR